MYRVFMPCDDPKGVVESGTIRNCGIGSQKMEGNTKSQRTAKKLDSSFTNKQDKAEMVLKGSTESFCHPSSLQLLQVSRGAETLNNMIDSWFRGPKNEGRSEDIARDVLKGALDLQESLVRLYKLQETSQDMTRLKAKPNEKPKRVGINATVIDRPHNFQFSDQSYLKFSRQNLYPITTTEGLNSASEIPSTSSSHSSGLLTDRISDSFFSPTSLKKERGPNVVAKLMGLEEFSSRSFPAAVQKQLEGVKILSQKRPVFEIDMPKVRKNKSLDKKVGSQRKKTLREILATMHFKGLPKKRSVRESRLQTHDPNSKRCDDLLPIVLIKPRCTPYQESVKVHATVPPEEFSLRKLKAEAVPSETVKCKDGSSNVGNKMEEEDVNKRLTQEEGRKHLKDVVEMDGKEIEVIGKAPNKVKLYSHVSHKSQLTEIDKKSKVKTFSSKLAEEISKPRIVVRCEDQEESISTKLRKPQSVSSINNVEVLCQQSSALNTISETRTQKITHSKDQRKNQMKKRRPVSEPEAAKPVVEEEDSRICVPRKDDCTEIKDITTVADEPPNGHEVESVDPSANKIGEDCKQSQSSSDDVTLLKSKHESDVTTEEVHEGAICDETYRKIDKDEAEQKYLLLTSQSFIGHAEELLNLSVDQALILQKYETDGIANLRLYLDCANEFAERKSLKASQTVRPFLPSCAGNSRLNISLGRLVEEIYNAIENLKIYSESSGQKLSVDNLRAIMERDINCNGLTNGTWEWGWGYGFSADEAEQVADEVESLVLNVLIEEVILNL